MASQTRVKLKDIAQVCGCSTNTVSCALRNDPRIALKTRQYIQEMADKLGYVRNNLASALRSGRTNTVAMVVNSIVNPHFTCMIRRIELLLNQRGYRMIIFDTHDDSTRVAEVIRIAISFSVDGILFYPLADRLESITLIQESKLPFVLLDRWIDGITANTVRLDDLDGGIIAGQKFLSLGHERFLYLAGPLHNSSQKNRQAGFLNAIEGAGHSRECVRIISWDETMRAIANNVLWELLQPLDFTAVFAFNDELAYTLYNELLKHGIAVPKQISILGFDHIHQYIEYLPPLSSISIAEGYDFAECTVSLLMQQIENEKTPTQIMVLPVSIYDEGTIRKAPGKCGTRSTRRA